MVLLQLLTSEFSGFIRKMRRSVSSKLDLGLINDTRDGHKKLLYLQTFSVVSITKIEKDILSHVFFLIAIKLFNSQNPFWKISVSVVIEQCYVTCLCPTQSLLGENEITKTTLYLPRVIPELWKLSHALKEKKKTYKNLNFFKMTIEFQMKHELLLLWLTVWK